MKNLLVICDIPDANIFFTSVNSDTLPLLYSKDALLDILDNNTFERIGIAFEKKELFDVDFTSFNVKHIDFLACDTLNDPMWLEYYKTLQDAGISVGASDNKTGNLKYGGDWVMESTSQDIEKVYFTESIEYYKYLLGATSRTMFAMKSDGLYGSGNNTFGQLGGNTRDTTVFTGALAVSCGDSHTVAIKDGILYGCGDGEYGRLGSAGTTGTLTPMSGETGFTAVSCGLYHTVAIKDGILYGCGRNNFGQLGSAVTPGGSTGTLIPLGLTGCTAVSCDEYHTVAIKDGILYGCGNGSSGKLGSAGSTGTLTPMSSGLTGFTAVSCGWVHTVAIKDGILYGCGDGHDGRLGSAVPYLGSAGTLTKMSELTGFTAVSCGQSHTVAISNGILYGCGSNSKGQLGSAAIYNVDVRNLKPMGLTEVTAVSCGVYYTVAIKDGILYGAGSNANYLLKDIDISQYNSFIEIATNVLNINDSGKLTTYLQFSQQPITSPDTLLSVNSNSPGAITYTSSNPLLLSVTGNIATPLKTGNVIITASQRATGNYFSRTVTGSVQVYYNNLGFTGLPSFINKKIILEVTSDSTGAITYTSSNPLVLSVTGTGKNFTVTPLQRGTGSIVVNQGANGNFIGATVTGSVQVYYNNLGFTGLPSMINKQTELFVTSDSTGAISYHSSNSVLSVTGTGTSCTVTPLQTGTGSIVVKQAENGNFIGATVTGSVQVYFANLGFIGFLSMINKETELFVTSYSPGAITYTSSDPFVLSVTGNRATPLQTGTGSIVVTQSATGNFLGATVTGSVQVYVTNLGFTGLPSMINKETKLSVISDSPGSISYTSNSILSVTGSGTNFTVTPLQTGTGTIVVYQGATGNFLEAKVTGSVQVYYNNLDFTGFPSFINKETTLSVTSDSTGAIHYSSSNPLVLSVTGTGKSCRVTPLQIGNVSIIVNQDANYPYSSETVTGSVKVYWNIEKIFDTSLYLSNGILYDDSTLISTDIGIIYASVIGNTYYYLNKEGNLYTIKCIQNSVEILFTSYIEIKTFRVVDDIIYICLIDGLYTFNCKDNRIRKINNLKISATNVKMYVTKKGSHVDIYLYCDYKIYIFNNDTYCVYNNQSIISQSYGETGLTGPICTQLTNNRNSNNNECFLLINIISGDEVSIKNPNWYYEDYNINNDKKITADNNITLQGNDKIYYNLKCNFVSKEISGETGSMVFLYGHIIP